MAAFLAGLGEALGKGSSEIGEGLAGEGAAGEGLAGEGAAGEGPAGGGQGRTGQGVGYGSTAGEGPVGEGQQGGGSSSSTSKPGSGSSDKADENEDEKPEDEEPEDEEPEDRDKPTSTQSSSISLATHSPASYISVTGSTVGSTNAQSSQTGGATVTTPSTLPVWTIAVIGVGSLILFGFLVLCFMILRSGRPKEAEYLEAKAESRYLRDKSIDLPDGDSTKEPRQEEDSGSHSLPRAP